MALRPVAYTCAVSRTTGAMPSARWINDPYFSSAIKAKGTPRTHEWPPVYAVAEDTTDARKGPNSRTAKSNVDLPTHSAGRYTSWLWVSPRRRGKQSRSVVGGYSDESPVCLPPSLSLSMSWLGFRVLLCKGDLEPPKSERSALRAGPADSGQKEETQE